MKFSLIKIDPKFVSVSVQQEKQIAWTKNRLSRNILTHSILTLKERALSPKLMCIVSFVAQVTYIAVG